MKIIVAIKRVVDPYVKIRIKPDESGVETDNVKKTINPFDEIAIEEAVRIKEKYDNVEIILVSIGDDKAAESLRAGLALGADRAIHIKKSDESSSLCIAKILSKICEKEAPNLILLGKQSIDNDNNQVGQMLSVLLDYPCATFASKITLSENKVQVIREIDGGLETQEITMPGIVTTDLRLNEPRYASLPNIMQAKRKPLAIIAFEALDLSFVSTQKILSVKKPEQRSKGKILDSVSALVACLKDEAKVI